MEKIMRAIAALLIFSWPLMALSPDSIFDGFERATLGPNWRVEFGGSQVQIVGGSDLGMGPGTQGFFLVNWVGSTPGADQFAEAVIPADLTPGWAHQPYVRWRASDRARYGFGYDNDPGQTLYYNKWYFKYDGVPGNQTRMFALADADTTDLPGPGDTLRVEISGYTLKGYFNGKLMLTATDTAANRIANGEPGLAARWATGNQQTNAFAKVWESFGTGTLGTPSPAEVPAPGEARLTVFPNPAKGGLTIQGLFPGRGKGTLRLLDIRGKAIFSSKETGEGGRFQVSLGPITPGIYVAVLEGEGTDISKRIAILK